MNVLKKIGIVFGVFLMLACLSLDVWYLYILMYGESKMTVNTVSTGVLTSAEGTSKYIGKIKYNTNENKNGHECFAWTLNYFRDEDMDSFHSQGFQYETNNINESLEFYSYEKFAEDISSLDWVQIQETQYISNKFVEDYDLNQEKVFLWTGNYYANYVNPYLINGISNNYQSTDGFASLETTNPITASSIFTLQYLDENQQEQAIYMQFLGSGFANYTNKGYTSSRELLGKDIQDGTFYSEHSYFYYNYAEEWFTYFLYDAVNELPAGTKGTFTFEFGDYFKFFDVNEDGSVGDEITGEVDRAKVINQTKSYFVFEVEISADGARSAKDSMFGILHNSPTYSVEGYDGTDGDYSFGSSIINLDTYDFDFVKIDDTNVLLKLKKDVLNSYLPYAEKVYFNIQIDKTMLSAQGYNYVGFAGDSGLENFKIYKIEEV